MSLFENTYALLRQVPAGRVTTYKELAHAQNTRAYRAIGMALRKNPYAPHVPCHRVVRSDATVGGFRGSKTGKDVLEKINILKEEGIEFEGDKIKDFEHVLYTFD